MKKKGEKFQRDREDKSHFMLYCWQQHTMHEAHPSPKSSIKNSLSLATARKELKEGTSSPALPEDSSSRASWEGINHSLSWIQVGAEMKMNEHPLQQNLCAVDCHG